MKIAYRFLLLFLALFSNLYGQLDSFLGKWQNIDPNTGDISSLNISLRNEKLVVEAWSKCIPKDCFWGEANALLYASRKPSHLANASQLLSAVFQTDSVETLMLIRPLEDRLRVEILSRSTDRKQRLGNFNASYNFFRSSQTNVPIVPLTPETIDEYIAWISRSTSANDEMIQKDLKKIRLDTTMIRLFFDRLQKKRLNDMGTSLVILGLIGKLRNPQTAPGLHALIQEPLPEQEKIIDDGLTKRNLQEMLQSKAVESLAYLKTLKSDSMVLQVIQRHPSQAVRAAAIDAFLYNHGDSLAVKERLRPLLKPEDTIFLDIVRRTRAGSAKEFDEGLMRFYKLHPEQVPPVSSLIPRDINKDKGSQQLMVYLPLMVLGILLLLIIGGCFLSRRWLVEK